MSKVDHACFRAHAALAPHLQLPTDVKGHPSRMPFCPKSWRALREGAPQARRRFRRREREDEPARRQRIYGSFGTPSTTTADKAKPSTGMAGRGWIERRYELGERMQSKG